MTGRRDLAAALAVVSLCLRLGGAAAESSGPAIDPIEATLTRGHPEVATLLATHPDLAALLHEPMWRDVVLHAPRLPGTPWRVHDLRRPQPPLVRPAPEACSRSAPPPSDAVVVFAGRDLEGFDGPQREEWEVVGGELVPRGRQANHLSTRAAFADVQIHLEFATPDPPQGLFQFRGNSGVFLMGRYEIQILDSWENPTYADGMLGALYGQRPPLVNASEPPGVWQCLEILFRAPQFAGKRLLRPARATVVLNGIVVQLDAAFRGPTRFAALRPYEAHPSALPFALQDHGEPSDRVRFRNIWARPLGLSAAPAPALP